VEGLSLQGCDAASLRKWLLTFRKNTLLSITRHSPSKATSHPRTLEPARTPLWTPQDGAWSPPSTFYVYAASSTSLDQKELGYSIQTILINTTSFCYKNNICLHTVPRVTTPKGHHDTWINKKQGKQISWVTMQDISLPCFLFPHTQWWGTGDETRSIVWRKILKDNKTISGFSQTQQYTVLCYLDDMLRSLDRHQANFTELTVRYLQCK